MSKIKEDIETAVNTCHALGYAIRRIKIADVELDLAPLPRVLTEEEKKALKRKQEDEALSMRYAHTGIVPRRRDDRV